MEAYLPGDVIIAEYYDDHKYKIVTGFFVVIVDQMLDDNVPNKYNNLNCCKITSRQHNTDTSYGYRLDSHKYPDLDTTSWIQFDQTHVIPKHSVVRKLFRLDISTRVYASPKLQKSYTTSLDKWLQK